MRKKKNHVMMFQEGLSIETVIYLQTHFDRSQDVIILQNLENVENFLFSTPTTYFLHFHTNYLKQWSHFI